MRITVEAQRQVRTRIVKSAAKLFSRKGFDETTTRDIATGAKIAAGTLFNYFPNKEALAMTLIADALDAAGSDYEARRETVTSLEEDLFLLVMTGLRRLEPFRAFVGAVLETAMSPFARTPANEDSERFKLSHIAAVADRMGAYLGLTTPSAVTMHLYWSLYLGVLAFWSKDQSPKQEDTLVVLDRAMQLFVASLKNEVPHREEVPHDA